MIWSGVASTNPWPMAMFTASPVYQGSPMFSSFHLGSGATPGASSSALMPVGAPNPAAFAKSGRMFGSMLSSVIAMSKNTGLQDAISPSATVRKPRSTFCQFFCANRSPSLFQTGEQ